MVTTKDLLTHGSTVKSSGNVQLPNGDSTKVTHSGCSQLQGGEVVKNVLYVPELNFNLLSVAKLTRQLNCCAIFYPDFFLLQDLFTGKVKEIGEEKGGLYILKSSQLIDTGQHRSFVAVKNSAEGEVWHKRLGHIPMSVLRKIDIFAHKRDFQLKCCNICPLARQVRLPFPNSSTRSLQCFDLVHMDVWGPYKITTHNKMKFFLTLVDDYSR